MSVAVRATCFRSTSSGWPFSRVELAFLTRPVAGEIAPGCPTPTRQRRADLRFELADHAGDGFDRRLVAVRGVGTRSRARSLAVVREDDALDLGAAEVDADAHGADPTCRGSIQRGRRNLKGSAGLNWPAVSPEKTSPFWMVSFFTGAPGFRSSLSNDTQKVLGRVAESK